jgi:RND family efflux transporter MFP subunit
MRRTTLQTLVALLVLGIGVVGCGTEEATKTESPRYVKVTKLGQNTNQNELVFNGHLKEKKEVDVAFKVGGQVYNVLVNEGDYVKKGQVIARIDPRDYKINLQSATAQYKQAKGEYTRYKELYEKKKLPINTLERMEAGYLGAKSAFEAATNALEDTELKAPFTGYIYQKHIDNFENVGSGQAIFSLLDVSHLEVRFSLPESKVDLASKFGDIYCDVQAASAFKVPAKVLSVNEKANGNDMFDVRLMVENNTNNALKPGMSVKVKVNIPEEENDGIIVPVESVFYADQKAYVWVYNQNDSKVYKQQVKVKSFANDGEVSVHSGLKGKEFIVTAGVYSLVENQSVKILENNKL